MIHTNAPTTLPETEPAPAKPKPASPPERKPAPVRVPPPAPLPPKRQPGQKPLPDVPPLRPVCSRGALGALVLPKFDL